MPRETRVEHDSNEQVVHRMAVELINGAKNILNQLEEHIIDGEEAKRIILELMRNVTKFEQK